MKLIPHQRPAAASAWIRREAKLQDQRYREISQYINETLAPQRERWIRDFLERIGTRGYHVHYDQLRKIPEAEMPKEPRRKHRVVF